MNCFRIETFNTATGAHEHTEIVDTPQDAGHHCREPWRAASTHVVYAVHTGRAPFVAAVYVAGRRVAPFGPWLGDLP